MEYKIIIDEAKTAQETIFQGLPLMEAKAVKTAKAAIPKTIPKAWQEEEAISSAMV